MDIEVVAFDVFGTLVDWRSSIARALAKAGEAAGLSADWPAAADAWRERYYPSLGTVLRGERAFQPLDVLHAEMLDEVIAERGLGTWTPQPGPAWYTPGIALTRGRTPCAGLTAMRERHILTPLSNGGVGLLTRLAKAAALPFDCILSAELAGTYKPDPRVYGLALLVLRRPR